MTFIKDNDTIIVPDDENPLMYGLGINFLKYKGIIFLLGIMLLSSYIITTAIMIIMPIINDMDNDLKYLFYFVCMEMIIIEIIAFSYFGKKRLIRFLLSEKGYKIKPNSMDEKESIMKKYKITDDFFID